MERSYFGRLVRCFAVLALSVSGVFACDGGEGTDSQAHDPRLYTAILREIHVEHPRPRPAKPKPLPEERQRVFTDRRVLKLADAMKGEDLKEIDCLLEARVHVNARGKLGCTPLV